MKVKQEFFTKEMMLSSDYIKSDCSKNLCQSGKITNTQGNTDEDRILFIIDFSSFQYKTVIPNSSLSDSNPI